MIKVDFESALKNSFRFYQILLVLPMPYVLSIFCGLLLKFNGPSAMSDSKAINSVVRKYDRLFICLVTKGVNKEAVYRSWATLQTLQDTTRGIYVYVVSDDPYYFDDLNSIVVPAMFECQYARAKARALEYFRINMRLTQGDWVLHLDEVTFIFGYFNLHWLIKTIQLITRFLTAILTLTKKELIELLEG